MSAVQAGAETKTNTWFNADFSGLSSGSGGWTKPADDDSEVVNGVIQLDTAGGVLSYAPEAASGANTNAFVDLSVQFVASDSEPDISGINGPQASLAVKASDGNLTYIAYTNGAWAALSGVSAVTNVFVNVRIEMDYAGNNAPRVRYLVGNAGVYTALTANNAEWLPLSDASVNTRSITNIGFLGSGKVGNFSGSRIYELAAIVVDLDGIGPAETPFAVSSTWLEAHNLTDDDREAINATLASEAANGQTVWKNIVLGLEDNDPLYIDASQDGGANAMRIALQVTPEADTGVSVTYKLQKKNGENWNSPTDVATGNSPSFDIPLNGDGASGVYRIIAIFSAAQ